MCAYPDSPSGRSPHDGRQLTRLSELTGLHFNGRLKHPNRIERAQISFERPKLSPCLQHIANRDSAEYKEALAIIWAGTARLEQQPRCDMEGFEPCPKDRERLDLFDRRARLEQSFRTAIRDKKRRYDSDK